MNSNFLKYLLSFGTGLYVGTYYNCKPYIDRSLELAKKYKPDNRD